MSNSLQHHYQNLSDKTDRISTREQFMILGCGLIIVIFFSYYFLIESTSKQLETNKTKIKSTQISLAALANELTTISSTLNPNPNAEIIEKIEALTKETAILNANIERQTQHLVPANKMASLLESMLVETQKLKLIELKSIAPILILSNTDSQNNKTNETIYRHGVVLVFEGRYFDIQQYLEKLESLQWKFHWQKFDYTVSEYPKATVELEMYTLSTNKAFIGV